MKLLLIVLALIVGCDSESEAKYWARKARMSECVSSRYRAISWRKLQDGYYALSCPGHLYIRHQSINGLLLECVCKETPKQEMEHDPTSS